MPSSNIARKPLESLADFTFSSFVEIIPATSQLFSEGLSLYRQRQDKAWGITDCTSFVVMQEHQFSEALTTDDDFVQAGFRALMLEEVSD
ncbi:MAG: type II toxin-antitoxin system VapC family toxin [Pyrinomonadaceae bacterium]